jgi:hypothetical protein
MMFVTVIQMNNRKENIMSAFKGVKRLAKENPNWIPIVEACVEMAKENEEFCGNWVRKKMERKTNEKVWFPGLRILTRYGILRHEDTTRGGRRAYYTMPDIKSVENGLAELGKPWG